MSISQRLPKYSLHKPSGQARVVCQGKHLYLGKHGSAESLQRYAEVISSLTSGLISVPDCPAGQFPTLSVDEVLLSYLEYASHYYSYEGQPTKEYQCMLDAVKHLRPKYGKTPAKDFGPRKLAFVREDMIANNLARTLINNRINRIRRVFKWAVSMELIPPGVYQGLKTLDGLKFGRSNAKESAPVKPVADSDIEKIVCLSSPQVGAMIMLQRYTGMRPGEVILMRSADIDYESSPWIFEPHTHKNRYRGHCRKVPLGPHAQVLIHPFLDRDPKAYLFCPVEAEQWRSQRRRQARKSPMTPSQASRKRKANPKRAKRERYDVGSYRRAIKYAIQQFNLAQMKLPEGEQSLMKPWHPHQLRHQFATVVRKELGAEAVQVGLGHKSTDLVDLYAEKNLDAAKSIAMKLG